MEGFRLVVDGLSLGGIDHQNSVVRLHGLLNLFHLVEESFFLLVSPACVNDDHLVLVLAKLRDALVRDTDGVGFRITPVEWTLPAICAPV